MVALVLSFFYDNNRSPKQLLQSVVLLHITLLLHTLQCCTAT
jgi:hypothetical protein